MAAFGDVYKFPQSTNIDLSGFLVNQTKGLNSLASFQFPKRKFPISRRVVSEWQGFEDLFRSILSHAADFPDVEKFKYLKTSLEGETLSLSGYSSSRNVLQQYESLGNLTCPLWEQAWFGSNLFGYPIISSCSQIRRRVFNKNSGIDSLGAHAWIGKLRFCTLSAESHFRPHFWKLSWLRFTRSLGNNCGR